jgi:hypothetical protein
LLAARLLDTVLSATRQGIEGGRHVYGIVTAEDLIPVTEFFDRYDRWGRKVPLMRKGSS